MGGHASGEVASQMAVETVGRVLHGHGRGRPSGPGRTRWTAAKGYEENRLITGIKLANLRIYERRSAIRASAAWAPPSSRCFFVDDGVIVAHVGDSRLYRIRDGKIEQLTEDHSLLNDYIKMKRLTAEEIANFPHKNVIVRALGMKDTVKVDTRYEQPARGRHLPALLRRPLGPGQRRRACRRSSSAEPDLDKCAETLIATANANGGPDNITVVLARIEPA